MAYRTSARSQPSDTAVCCARCGSLTSIALAANRDRRFTCRKCETHQPVLRDDDDLAIAKIEVTDYNAVLNYKELSAFAKEVGKDVETGGLDLVCDGMVVKIAVNINSGTVMGLDHVALTTGLPSMRFVRESPSHVDKKQTGVVKEVQTGDPGFDDEVYIESPASDDDVLTVLSSPAVRKAIRELLGDCDAVTIDAFSVRVYVEHKKDPYVPKDLRKRLGWLRVVAGAPRPLVSEEVAVPARARLTKWIVGLACPLAVFLFVLAHVKWTPVHSDQTVGCIFGGFVFAALMAPVYTLLLRGRSTSHREISAMRITTFLFAPLLVPGLLLTYNGAFDESKERMTDMKIVRAWKDDEDDKYHAKTVDDRGSEHQYSFKSAVPEGWFVRVPWKDGALGWTWESGDAIVVQAPGKP